MQYIISPITTYDEDEQLYYTKVGVDNMQLHYIVCGQSKSISRERAENLVSLLNNILP